VYGLGELLACRQGSQGSLMRRIRFLSTVSQRMPYVECCERRVLFYWTVGGHA
jgi:hypothetical protein